MIALYLRLSNEDKNAGESDSIQGQRRILRGYVSEHPDLRGEEIQEFIDDGYSGVNFDRPAVKRMLAMLGHSVRCIIVKDFSRFSRNLLDVGEYLDQKLPYLGVRFISVNDNYDNQDKGIIGGTMSIDQTMKALMHELHCRDTSAKIRQVQQYKMRNGEYLCAIAFYGYKRSETHKNQLEIDEDAAQTVREVFRMAADGTRLMDIAKELNHREVPSPLSYRKQHGGYDMRGWKVAGKKSIWTTSNVRRMIADLRYTGCLVARKREKIDVTTKRTRPVPEDEWIVAENTHEPIVSKELFDTAQKILKPYKKRGVATQQSLFRGILKCGVCGRTLVLTKCKAPYYLCVTERYQDDAECAGLHLNVATLHKTVLAAAKAHASLVLDRGIDALIIQEDEDANFRKRHAQALQKKEKYRTKRSQLFEEYATKQITESAYAKERDRLCDLEERVDWELAEINKKVDRLNFRENSAKSEEKACSKHIHGTSLTREMLTELIKEILVYPGNAMEIRWRFSDLSPKNHMEDMINVG